MQQLHKVVIKATVDLGEKYPFSIHENGPAGSVSSEEHEIDHNWD